MMRKFFQAFLAFLIFAVIAQFFFSKKSEFPQKFDTTQNIKTKPLNNTPPVKVLVKKDTLVKKSSAPVFTYDVTELKFKHKFITSSKHHRVLFPKKFYYFKDSIVNFIKNNPQKEIIITASYLKNEVTKNNVNSGMLRATYLKNKLVTYGIAPNKIVTKNKVAVYKYDSNGFYADGIIIEHQNTPIKKKKQPLDSLK